MSLRFLINLNSLGKKGLLFYTSKWTSNNKCLLYEYSKARNFHLYSYHHRKSVPFILSDIGEGIKEVTIKEWFVSVGDKVSQFDPICEVQSDKASVTISSKFDGQIQKLHFKEEQVAQTGDALIHIDVLDEEDEDIVGVKDDDDNKEKERKEKTVMEFVKSIATPAVRRIAIENKVSLENIVGSGKGNRVLKEDILKFIDSTQSLERSSSSQHLEKNQPTLSSERNVKFQKNSENISKDSQSVPMTSVMKAMTKTMTESLKIPHFGYFDDIDVSSLLKIKESLKRTMDLRISLLPFIIKFTSKALLEYNILNCTPNYESNILLYHSEVNIGVAMDTPMGLLVPVIKNASDLSILQIYEELNRLRSLASQGKLSIEDLSGGTFTLSNIGSIGGTYAIPLIFPSQVGIGAIGKIGQDFKWDPRTNNHTEVFKLRVSWSADHRVIDGATLARFSNRLKGFLECPESCLLHLK